MMYEVYKIQPEYYTRISKISHIIEFNWGDDIDRIFLNFSFSTSENIEVGTWIELFNKNDYKTVFRGLITTKTQNNEQTYSYSGFDLGFFVEKNKITKQYKEPTKINDAIEQALKEVEIPCKNLPDFKETVKKPYKTTPVSEILKDLLKRTNRFDYYYSCKKGYVELLQHTENDNLSGYIANIYSLKSTNTIHSFEIKSSIEGMKNKIAVLIDEKLDKEYIKEDSENTKKFGILQEAIEPSNNDNNYQKLAETKLNELNKITNEFSMSVLADSNMRMGIIIPIKKETINIDDKYLIKSSEHSINGTKEIVNVKLEKYIG